MTAAAGGPGAGAGVDNWLHARVVYPAVVRARGEGQVFAALREMRAAERLPATELAARQRRRLAEILEYACSRSPYYAAAWAGAAPFHAHDAVERLAGLPMLGKAELQGEAERMRVTPPPGRVTRKVTGGSTGQAVTVYKDRAAIAREMAASWMGYGWFGIGMGDRAARFWGSPRTLKRRLRFAAADFAMHRVRFSAFAFDDGDLERYWRRCVGFRPQYFYGYVSMLEAFARFVAERGYDGRALGLKAVVTTSEVLSPPQRALLRDVFGAPVQNEYGCGELGPIAYECEAGRLHLMSENLFVEVLAADGRPAAAGEPGEIVVTDLNNRAMPLVRYRVGDFGVRAEGCACGRGFPALEKIWGRAYDFVQLPSGRRCHGEYFMYLFEELRARGIPIHQFRVVQKDRERLEVTIVAPAPFRERASAGVAALLAQQAPGMSAAIHHADQIARAPSGKMRLIVNEWLQPA